MGGEQRIQFKDMLSRAYVWMDLATAHTHG